MISLIEVRSHNFWEGTNQVSAFIISGRRAQININMDWDMMYEVLVAGSNDEKMSVYIRINFIKYLEL